MNTSAIAVAVFITALYLLGYYHYCLFIRPRRSAVKRCITILFELKSTTKEQNDDLNALEKIVELEEEILKHGIDLNEIGLDDTKLVIVKQNAYKAFSLYMANFRFNHGLLEAQLLKAQEIRGDKRAFLNEIRCIGPAYAKSAEVLQSLEAQTAGINLKFTDLFDGSMGEGRKVAVEKMFIKVILPNGQFAIGIPN